VTLGVSHLGVSALMMLDTPKDTPSTRSLENADAAEPSTYAGDFSVSRIEIEPRPEFWIRNGKRGVSCIRENSVVNLQERIVSY
jgi:hypothetical protein